MNTGLSVQEFYERARLFTKEHLPQCRMEVAEKNALRLKARVRVSLSAFIDFFYAARTERISFAVIFRGERVFGMDNLGGWHVHPVGESQEHHKIEAPTLEEAFEQCVRVAEALMPT
jgi:hypothetical protein